MLKEYDIEVRLTNERNAGYLLRINRKTIEYWEDFNGQKKKVTDSTPERLNQVQSLLQFAYVNAVRIIEESTQINVKRPIKNQK